MTTTGPLDAVEATFQQLGAGSDAASLSAHTFAADLPPRPMTAPELRSWLLNPGVSYSNRDLVVEQLMLRARSGGDAPTLVLVGTLLPGLRRAVGRLSRSAADRRDVEAEVLTCLVEAIRTLPVGRGRVAARLINTAVYAARRRLAAERGHRGDVLAPDVAAGLAVDGHPDTVLARACRHQVLTPAEVDLIGETRLGDTSLRQYADQLRVPYGTVRLRRYRAERRLTAWLLERAA